MCRTLGRRGNCGIGFSKPRWLRIFSGLYHEDLSKGPFRTALLQLACAAMKEDFTLVFQGDDPQQNTATALYEFISELEAYCPREGDNI